MTIKKGDRFRCIFSVVMHGGKYNGEVCYFKGKTYTSEKDGCITDEQGKEDHYWNEDLLVEDEIVFEKIADTPNPIFSDDQQTESRGERHQYVYKLTQSPYIPSSIKSGDKYENIDPIIDQQEDVNLDILNTSYNLQDLLQYKHKKYGQSGLKPINVFSKVEATTGLLQRIDDKIARIQNSSELRKNDVADLMGYLTLLCISKGWTTFDEFKD